MSRIITFVAGFALAVGLFASAMVVFAQSDSLARFTPFVIDVTQAVPVEVSVPIVEDGETVSKTVPLTVSVALQVRVDGPQDATVEVIEEPTPVVTVATATRMPSRTTSNSDSVIVGDIEWQLLTAESTGQTLKGNNAFIPEIETSGQFIQIDFSMKNVGKEAITYMGIDLIDGEGRSYKPSTDALMLIPQEKQCSFEQVNPGVVRTCTVVYEVPSDATGMGIQFSDLNMIGAEIQVVDIGL